MGGGGQLGGGAEEDYLLHLELPTLCYNIALLSLKCQEFSSSYRFLCILHTKIYKMEGFLALKASFLLLDVLLILRKIEAAQEVLCRLEALSLDYFKWADFTSSCFAFALRRRNSLLSIPSPCALLETHHQIPEGFKDFKHPCSFSWARYLHFCTVSADFGGVYTPPLKGGFYTDLMLMPEDLPPPDEELLPSSLLFGSFLSLEKNEIPVFPCLEEFQFLLQIYRSKVNISFGNYDDAEHSYNLAKLILAKAPEETTSYKQILKEKNEFNRLKSLKMAENSIVYDFFLLEEEEGDWRKHILSKSSDFAGNSRLRRCEGGSSPLKLHPLKSLLFLRYESMLKMIESAIGFYRGNATKALRPLLLLNWKERRMLSPHTHNNVGNSSKESSKRGPSKLRAPPSLFSITESFFSNVGSTHFLMKKKMLSELFFKKALGEENHDKLSYSVKSVKSSILAPKIAYNLGVVLLSRGKSEAAFSYLSFVACGSSCNESIMLWIRLAECCISNHLQWEKSHGNFEKLIVKIPALSEDKEEASKSEEMISSSSFKKSICRLINIEDAGVFMRGISLLCSLEADIAKKHIRICRKAAAKIDQPVKHNIESLKMHHEVEDGSLFEDEEVFVYSTEGMKRASYEGFNNSKDEVGCELEELRTGESLPLTCWKPRAKLIFARRCLWRALSELEGEACDAGDGVESRSLKGSMTSFHGDKDDSGTHTHQQKAGSPVYSSSYGVHTPQRFTSSSSLSLSECAKLKEAVILKISYVCLCLGEAAESIRYSELLLKKEDTLEGEKLRDGISIPKAECPVKPVSSMGLLLANCYLMEALLRLGLIEEAQSRVTAFIKEEGFLSESEGSTGGPEESSGYDALRSAFGILIPNLGKRVPTVKQLSFSFALKKTQQLLCYNAVYIHLMKDAADLAQISLRAALSGEEKPIGYLRLHVYLLLLQGKSRQAKEYLLEQKEALSSALSQRKTLVNALLTELFSIC